MGKRKSRNRSKTYEKRQQDKQISREKSRLRKMRKKNDSTVYVKEQRREDSLLHSHLDLAHQLHESRQNEALLRRFMKTEAGENRKKLERLDNQVKKLAAKNKILKKSLIAAIIAALILLILVISEPLS
ncbi:hypothetical protein G3M81_12485 [Bacillus paralicheniformis]|uniref:hypothetical protein n=1 Tax=Bacillus paralicheniformis TaxID=1648923 RepID=UPI0013EF1365|nr:hypothetical protein [Bacillus paralicheniformis]QII49507.1 hypothetical protein G3M81_12485 [Bacillus paralicheniformis]